MANQQKLAFSVVCHCWNSDRTRIAFSPNSKQIEVGTYAEGKFTKEAVLKEHDSLVSGIDWAPKSNRLVSCSHDRNGYVYEPDGKKWKPTMVLLRINRAALDCKWSPNEQKFAVASGAKIVCICYYEPQNEWWVSKHIKGHRSAVTKVVWSPDSLMVATTSTDFKAKIVCAHVKEVDGKENNTIFGKKKFGEVLYEVDCSRWTNAIDWSSDGKLVVVVGHDSSVTVIDLNGGEPFSRVIKMNTLPFCAVKFMTNTKFVAVGHEYNPHLFEFGEEIKLIKTLDTTGQTNKAAAGANNAFKMFQNKVDKGTTEAKTTFTTKHQNLVNCIQPYSGTPGNVTQFSTTGIDGCIFFWKL